MEKLDDWLPVFKMLLFIGSAFYALYSAGHNQPVNAIFGVLVFASIDRN
jgi:hypothetical protein